MQEHRTGLAYDERMSRHYNLWHDDYSETPERITAPFEVCERYGLVERCHRIPCREATDAEAMWKHSPEYMKTLEATQHMTEDELKEISAKYDYIYFHPRSYKSAKLGLGATLDLVSAVLKDEVQNGLAIIRPPGHHAMYQESCGYCHINNVAIAAQMAIDNFGLQRVLIVDWDVHHGQGTQYMFYDDPRVLYFSIHTYDYGLEWPYLRESDYDYIGVGAGTGFNINVPLNKQGLGNSEYLAIFQQILLPIAYEFCPELILVSAGYDSAIGCPEGRMEVHPAMYGHFVSLLSGLAGGKICLIQEGGYCVKSLSESIALSLKALLGDPCQLIEPLETPDISVVESILNVIKVLRPFWKSLMYQRDLKDPRKSQLPALVDMPPKPGIRFYTDEKPLVYDLFEETYESDYLEVRELLYARIDQLVHSTKLTYAPNKLCIVFEETMLMHKEINNDDPEEKPERISHCKEYLVSQGLWKQCLHVQGRIATQEELTLSHSVDYVKQMQRTSGLSEATLLRVQRTFNSIYLCQDSYLAAAMAAGSLLSVVDTVLEGKGLGPCCLLYKLCWKGRPPGHHAIKSHAQGFCLFNNIGIAAKYAQNKYGVNRILIVDWDAHHGNALQRLFYGDSSVLYISLHKFDHGDYYPFGHYGSPEKVGEKDGIGYNINIAWNNGPKGDGDYIAAFQQIVMPVAYQFGPELVLIASGFDVAAGDRLGSYEMSPLGFAHMTQMLKSLANGNIILALEGGYTLESTSTGMAACVSVLLGNPCPSLSSVIPRESAIADIKKTIQVQKKYWSCLQYDVCLPTVALLKDIKKKKKQCGDVEQVNKVDEEEEEEEEHQQEQEKECIVESHIAHDDVTEIHDASDDARDYHYVIEATNDSSSPSEWEESEGISPSSSSENWVSAEETKDASESLVEEVEELYTEQNIL